MSQWKLARDVTLLTPEVPNPVIPLDYISYSFAWFKADNTLSHVVDDVNSFFVRPNLYPDEVRRLMCENVGEMIIQWTIDGATIIYDANLPSPNNANKIIKWYGREASVDKTLDPIENDNLYYNKGTLDSGGNYYYTAAWRPAANANVWPWPKALRFTFTIYDSKGIIKGGKTFTHIVYLKE